MYTAGHEQILEAALKPLLRSGEVQLSGEEREALRQGLAYPDFPCGGVKVMDKDELLRDTMQPCSLAATAMGMWFDRLSLSFQSHNGLYSLWHAMTPDPDKSVANIARNVCEYVLICCSLAWRRRSLFWLGFALHIVMDAYSPAHVLREGAGLLRGAADADLVTWLRTHDDELDPAAAANVGQLRQIIREVVQGVAAGRRPSAILEAQPPELRHLAAFALFDHQQRRQLPVRVLEARLCASGARASADAAAASARPHRPHRPHRILNFHYYPRQRGLFHNMQDLLSAAKRGGVYEQCVLDTRDLLRLFFGAQRGPHPPQRSAGRPRAANPTLPAPAGGPGGAAPRHKAFLQGVLRVLHHTFAIHPDCCKVETGFDLQRVLQPVHRTLHFDAAPDLGPGVFRCSARPDLLVRAPPRRQPGTFVLPTVRNAATRPEVVSKTYRFTLAAGSSARRPAAAKWLRYKLIETAEGLGYPVSVTLASGGTYRHPVLVQPTVL